MTTRPPAKDGPTAPATGRGAPASPIRQPQAEQPGADARPMPADSTVRERCVAEALYADTWTAPNLNYGPEWHHRYPWWMCVRAARIAVPALDTHDDALHLDPGGDTP